MQAAKDVVLAEKPTISDDSNMLDQSLLDDLLANIATLASVYHKPPDAFVSRTRPTQQRDEDEEYAEQDSGTGDTSAPLSEAGQVSGGYQGASPSSPLPPPGGYGAPPRATVPPSGPPPPAAAVSTLR